MAIGMLAGGMSARVVARQFGCCGKTIGRLAARYQQTGPVHERQRPGRPRVTTARADRFITLTHLRQRQLAVTVTARQYGVSGQTIRNRLHRDAQPIRPPSCSQGHHSILAAKQCQRNARARGFTGSQPY